jgi:RNA polymerase sigma-70 factor (ECF subfamily)
MAVAREDSPLPAPAALRADATAQLIDRARAGDEAAREALFARYLEPLRRWATGRLPRWARDARDTQDLVQETLLRTFRLIDQFEYRREGALQAYLRQAMTNSIRYELRRFHRRGPAAAVDSGISDDAPSPLERAIGAETAARYEAALAKLRPEDREAIIARVEMGYSYERLAEAMGKPSPEAARKAARRALIRLASEMERPS